MSSNDAKTSTLYDATAAAPKSGIMSRRRRPKKEISDTVGDKKIVSGAYLRMERDLSEIEWPENVRMVNKTSDLMHIRLRIKVDQGIWEGGVYEFKFDIPDKYPIDAPKVLCMDKIYHPNIDLEGHVCVSVLKGGWKAVYTIQIVMFALLFLFTNPNPDDPLNVDAAFDMRDNLNRFKTNVKNSMNGKVVSYKDMVNESFPVNKGLQKSFKWEE